MRYLLDTHSLSNRLLGSFSRRGDLYVIPEVMEEYVYSEADARKVTRAGVQIVGLAKKHLERIKDVMAEHGNNFKLIRLYTSEGMADVAMLGFMLAERDSPDSLFSEPYTLVTQDKELHRIAESYGLTCLNTL